MKKICILFIMAVSVIMMAAAEVSKNLNPIDFGAKGDGVTDDTEAFNRLDAAIAANPGAVEVMIPSGVFMVNPLKTPLRELAPGVTRRKCLIMLRNDYSKVSGSGLIKIIKEIDYTVGMKNGQEWYWTVVLIRASYCTIDGLHFSGNGTGTYQGHIAKQPNLRWEGVSALGTGDNKSYHVANKIINCSIIEGGGQALAMQNQKQAVIANNIVGDSSGMGFSRCDDSILTGNIATRSHDAPFLANGNCNNIIIANNISRGTTNGSGIDVVGCKNVTVINNIIENSAAWGVLIGYSAQQKAGCSNILVSGNIFNSNCRSIDTPMNGEICVGRPWSSGLDSAVSVTISNNKFTVDGSHGDFKGNIVSIGYDARDVYIISNTINGVLNKQNSLFAVWQPTENLIISNNLWTGNGNAELALKASVKGIFEMSANRMITNADGAKRTHAEKE